MASQHDLQPRIDALAAAGWNMGSIYQGTPPQWLVTALDTHDALVINAKGVGVDETLVLISLPTFENMTAIFVGQMTEPMQEGEPA